MEVGGLSCVLGDRRGDGSLNVALPSRHPGSCLKVEEWVCLEHNFLHGGFCRFHELLYGVVTVYAFAERQGRLFGGNNAVEVGFGVLLLDFELMFVVCAGVF